VYFILKKGNLTLDDSLKIEIDSGGHGGSSMKTRSMTEKAKMEEAAQTLLSLSQEPRQHVPLRFIYDQIKYERVMNLIPKTKHGDTILMDFYVDHKQRAFVKYIKNEESKINIYTIHDHYDNITMRWTYEVGDFPFDSEDDSISFAQ